MLEVMTTRSHGKRPREAEAIPDHRNEDDDEGEEDLDLDLSVHESDDDDDVEEKNYTVLSESDIRRRQEDVIEALSGVLSISYASSSVLLSHHNWCVTEVCESWYVDEPAVRARVGLLETPVQEATLQCRICLENKDTSAAAAPCGHLFCASCWRTHIGTWVANNDGPGCLSLRCPDPSCDAAVDRDMVSRLASAEDREIYERRFVRSYVESNNKKKKIKWCPAPGCHHAVELEFVPSGGFDVTCACSNRFCWSCTEEAHHPVHCDTVAKWLAKSGDESHNIEWASLDSKPCPKCGAARIRKSRRGCMHMSCPPPCMHEFCWLCLREWSEHGSSSCNAFEERRRRSVPKSRWMIAKVTLERYKHYFYRWSANDASRANALSELARFQTEDELAILQEKQNVKDCQFVLDAWMVIVECRRVLKWSYVYGYYLPQEEEGNKKVVFFEFLQGVAEAGLERLHKLAEVDLRGFIDAEGCCEDFLRFREELVNLTTMTRNYFEKLVRAMEKGF